MLWLISTGFVTTRMEDTLGTKTRLEQCLVDQLLMEQGMLIVDQHIVLGNGFCARSYVHTAPLIRWPAKVMEYVHQLLDVIPKNIIAESDMIAGPQTGGQLFGFSMAAALEGQGRFGPGGGMQFAPMYKDRKTGELYLRKYFRDLISGGNVLHPEPLKVIIIDDVCLTGNTLDKATQLVTEAGGTVLGVYAVIDRGQLTKDLINYDFVEQSELDAKLIPTAECDDCRFGVHPYEF